MLVSLVLFLFVSSAQAEEPTVTVPAINTVAPRVNRPGLRNKAPSVVTFDEQGCPRTHDLSPQYRTAEEVETIMGAATDASVRCVTARAEAEAIRDSSEAERLDAKGRYGATLMLASAGADAVRAAADRGEATYTNGESLVSASGGAAFVAAASNGSGSGISPLGNYGYGVAAWNLTRPPVQQVTPPPADSAPPPSSAAAPKSAPKPATVEDAEARTARILGE